MESLSPFLWGSFIPYNMPVYPGALRFARHPPRIADNKDAFGGGWKILVVARRRAGD